MRSHHAQLEAPVTTAQTSAAVGNSVSLTRRVKISISRIFHVLVSSEGNMG